jgi:hypothetical protein
MNSSVRIWIISIVAARLIVFSSMMVAFPIDVWACRPVEHDLQTPEAVRKRYEDVDTVVIATLIHTRKLKVKSRMNSFELPVEEDTFPIDRVLKGKGKIGDRFALTTTLSGCGISAVNDPPWIYDARGKPVKDLDKVWLIYRNARDTTQITNSPYTRLIGPASDDLKELERLAGHP